jgi:thiol:disulfide interchange protein
MATRMDPVLENSDESRRGNASGVTKSSGEDRLAADAPLAAVAGRSAPESYPTQRSSSQRGDFRPGLALPGGSSVELAPPPSLSSVGISAISVAAILLGVVLMLVPFMFPLMSIAAQLIVGAVGAWFTASGIVFAFAKRPDASGI